MNNTVLKILAAVLALGAIAVAIIGIRLSQQGPRPAPATPVASAPQVQAEPVVVLVHAVRAGHMLGPADVAIKELPSPPGPAYRQTQDVLGKVALADIRPGMPLLPSQFVADSLASLLRPGERAVAVMVDEVIGLGGFAKPGDHVDVLAYVPVNRETNTYAFSQVAIQNARVLTFGETTQWDAGQDRDAAASAPEAPVKKSDKNSAELKEFRSSLRSAVLAIPETEAARLMLAASSGTLRLALRPQMAVQAEAAHAAMASASAPAGNAGTRYTTTTLDLAPTAVMRNTTAIATGQGSPDDVVIQEGSEEHRLSKNDIQRQP